MNTVLLAVTLGLNVPPNTPVSPKLEHCIAEVEICMDEAKVAGDGMPSDDDTSACVGAYEDCSYDIDDAHVSSCRLSYAWCVLGEFTPNAGYLAFCAAVRRTCPNPL